MGAAGFRGCASDVTFATKATMNPTPIAKRRISTPDLLILLRARIIADERRHPSPHQPGVVIVRRTETRREVRLFVSHHEEVAADEEEQPVPDEWQRPLPRGLTKHNRRHGEVHRIADITVKTTHDQLPRRIDRRERALPTSRKFKNARGEERRARDDAYQSEKMHRVADVNRRAADPKELPRNVTGDGPRHHDGPRHTAKREPCRRAGARVVRHKSKTAGRSPPNHPITNSPNHQITQSPITVFYL